MVPDSDEFTFYRENDPIQANSRDIFTLFTRMTTRPPPRIAKVTATEGPPTLAVDERLRLGPTW